MARGGIYDQLAGGFARYSVDADWVVPHFEKMLYDNALLLRRVRRQRRTDVGRWAAEGIADFLLGELRTAEGGFASALDADSEGVEGAFYVWTPAQLVEALGPETARGPPAAVGHRRRHVRARHVDAAAARGPRRPRAVVRRPAPAAGRARPSGCARPATTRSSRRGTGWRSAGWSGEGRLLDGPTYVEAAVAAGDLLARCTSIGGRLRRVSRDGVVGAPAGVLEDYGCVAAGFLDLLQVTGDPVWLERAGALLDTALDALPGRRRRLLRHRRRRRGAGRPTPRPQSTTPARRASPRCCTR